MRNHENRGLPVVIRLFLDIAAHRKGPQDVPAHGSVLAWALAAYLVFGAASLWPSMSDVGVLARHVALDVGLAVLVFGGVLAGTGRLDRVPQTLAALFGTGALLSAAALPFVWLAASAAGEAGNPRDDAAVLVAAMALLVLLLASLLVTGHILRHALDWPYPAGVLGAVLYFALTVALFRRLFPVT